MELFGMGLLLEVRDRASSSLRAINSLFNQTYSSAEELSRAMNEAQQSITNLAMGCTSLVYGGKNLIAFGTGITDTFKAVSSQIIKTGSQFENYRKTLKALYKDEELAKEKASWAMDLASTTPFEITDIMPALIGLKATGIEADQAFKDTNGEMRTFLEYVGDLAALRPDVGMQGVLMGVRNLMGGDGGRSLKMRLDLDPEQIIGRELATTSEGLMQDVVDLSQKIAGGLMKELEGTWDQLISNISDQKSRLLLAIGDAGAFDKAKGTLKKFYDFVAGIKGEELDIISSNLADIFNDLWAPVDKLASGLVYVLEVVKELILTNPELVKNIASLVMFSGIAITLIGGLAVLGGMIGLVRVGLAQFKLGILGMANSLGIVTTTVGGFLSTIGLLAVKLLLVVGAVALLYNLWQKDFMGIKTFTLDFVSKMVEFAKILFDAWDYELSDENYAKVQELGLLPLLNTILDLKMHIEEFAKGFGTGFTKAIDTLILLGEKIVFIKDKTVELLEKLGILKPAVEGVTDPKFDTAKWEKIGEVVGYLSVILIGAGLVAKVFTLGKAIFGIVATIAGPLLSGIGSILVAIGPVGWAILGIVAIFVLLYAKCDTFREWWGVVWETLRLSVQGLIDFIVGAFTGDWEKAWNGLGDFVINLFNAVVLVVKGIVNTITGLINSIIRGINSIKFQAPDWDWLPDNIQGASFSLNIPEIPKLNTGGYVKDEGISMLHPNEVVINDPLTRKLRAFLDGGSSDGGSDVISTSNSSSAQSLLIEKGAIVINVESGSQQDAEAIADKVIKKIEKKAKVKQLVAYQ